MTSVAILAIALLPLQTTPETGSKERKAILDALRPKVEKAIGQKVIFKVKHLKTLDDWAFMYGNPIQPNGKPIDWKKTKFKEALAEGAFDDNCCGLMKKVDGKWTVKDWRVGMTDVGWDGWWTTYKAPRKIFPSY